tara:strand:- start:265 stop:420 length:156 start_codon:yes stop_codon:yes gene_type:complete
MTTDKEYLIFLRDRLYHAYDEPLGIDYMVRLQKIIDNHYDDDCYDNELNIK